MTTRRSTLSRAEFFHPQEFETRCVQSFKQATGRQALPAKTGHLLHSPYRVLVRVGLLGPALGGQCILDFPLLTALNLCSLSLFRQNFTSLKQDASNENILKQILGLPLGKPVRYDCQDTWVKRIDVPLGPVYNHEVLKVTLKEQDGHLIAMRIQSDQQSEQILPLDTQQRAVYTFQGVSFLFQALNTESVMMELDESEQTLGPVPPEQHEHHILAQINQQAYLVKSGGSLVKSSLLEMANQISPSMIPTQLTGDISPPRLIPSREAHLPLPNLKRYNTEVLIMGAGPVRIKLELGNISDLQAHHLEILKDLFDHTFYHPELKKIFGS